MKNISPLTWSIRDRDIQILIHLSELMNGGMDWGGFLFNFEDLLVKFKINKTICLSVCLSWLIHGVRTLLGGLARKMVMLPRQEKKRK